MSNVTPGDLAIVTDRTDPAMFNRIVVVERACRRGEVMFGGLVVDADDCWMVRAAVEGQTLGCTFDFPDGTSRVIELPYQPVPARDLRRIGGPGMTIVEREAVAA